MLQGLGNSKHKMMNGTEMIQSKDLICIVKVGGTPMGGGAFKKWHVNNIQKFIKFLNKDHPTWRYFNVYDNKTKTQVGSFRNS